MTRNCFHSNSKLCILTFIHGYSYFITIRILCIWSHMYCIAYIRVYTHLMQYVLRYLVHCSIMLESEINLSGILARFFLYIRTLFASQIALLCFRVACLNSGHMLIIVYSYNFKCASKANVWAKILCNCSSYLQHD